MDSNSQYPKDGDPFIVPFSVRGSIDAKSLLPPIIQENTPNGPMPHVIREISDVKIQRLQKKIRKLTQQRDHWKNEYERLSYILRLFPYMHAERDYKRSQETSEKLKRLSHYESIIPTLVRENERLKAQIEKAT